MEENIKISGIKCDNEQCDYRDDSVEFKDYPNWLNKACPKCGQNLLTQEEYDACIGFTNMVDTFSNNLPEDFLKDAEKMMAEMNLTEDDVNDMVAHLFEMFKEQNTSKEGDN